MSRFVVTYRKWLLNYYKRFLQQVLLSGARVLTIYTNHLGGNLVHKHKTKKFNVVGEQSTPKYTQNRLKTGEKLIASNYSPYFLKLPKQNKVNHLIFQPEFTVFPCKL